MAVPVITSISPFFGFYKGGTSVVFVGSGFLTGVTSRVVTFDGVAATNVVVASDVSMTVVLPEISAPAAVPVVVTTNEGVSNAVTFYALPSSSNPSASFSATNPFFDPQGAYVFFGPCTFAQPFSVAGLPNAAHAGTKKFLMIDTVDNKIYYQT